MQRFYIEDKDFNRVHFMNAGQADLTLCGVEMDGDSTWGIKPAVRTNKKVDCPHCIKIVLHCKKIYKSEMKIRK